MDCIREPETAELTERGQRPKQLKQTGQKFGIHLGNVSFPEHLLLYVPRRVLHSAESNRLVVLSPKDIDFLVLFVPGSDLVEISGKFH